MTLRQLPHQSPSRSQQGFTILLYPGSRDNLGPVTFALGFFLGGGDGARLYHEVDDTSELKGVGVEYKTVKMDGHLLLVHSVRRPSWVHIPIPISFSISG